MTTNTTTDDDFYRKIVERLRPRNREHQTAVLAGLVREGDLTNAQAKDLLFMIIMDEIGIPVRRRAAE